MSSPCLKPCLRLREFKLVEKTTLSGSDATFPTRRFRFSVPDGTPLICDCATGEYMKLHWNWQKGEKPRSYNPLFGGVGGSSSEPGTFDLVVKIYENRNGSAAWLDKVEIGETLDMSGPFPRFPEMNIRNEGGLEVGIVCYGVAIVEAIAIADAELKQKDVQWVTLLWANRKRDDRALVDELLLLTRQHPQRLIVKQIFSQDEGGDWSGHVVADILQEAFPVSDKASARFHVVGTSQMKKDTWVMLDSLGYSEELHQLIQEQSSGPIFSLLEGLIAFCCCWRSR